MEGIKKNIRYWSWISGKNMLMLIGFAVFFGILFGMLDGGVPEVLSVTSFYLLLFGVMCGGAMQVAAIQVYMGQCIAMGAKRKDVFFGMQYTNWIPAIVIYLFALICQFVTGTTGMNDWGINMWSGQTVFFYVAAVLLVNGLGNIVSILCARFGKAGMVAFVMLAACWGGMMGGMASMLADGYIPFFPSVPKALVMIIPAVLYIVSAVIQYRIVRKYEIHV